MKKRFYRAVCLAAALAVCLSAVCISAAAFEDVTDGSEYSDAVSCCMEKGLMLGVSDESFDVNGVMTRAMLATVLWRLDGERYVNYFMRFTDVPSEAWYTEAVRWASAQKLIVGYDEEHFAPDDPVLREQLAEVLFRYAAWKGYDLTIDPRAGLTEEGSFHDTAEYALSSVLWALDRGILTARDGWVRPKAAMTRGEAARAMQRFCEKCTGAEKIYVPQEFEEDDGESVRPGLLGAAPGRLSETYEEKVSNGYVWPVPGFYGIVSGFGERMGCYHGGIDISELGIYGAAVVAAETGTVNPDEYVSDGWGGGYGIQCTIEHADGYSTFYAHLSKLIVEPGERVAKGQTIGYVGSSGDSTGPHLHFECRLWGVRYDPLSEF